MLAQELQRERLWVPLAPQLWLAGALLVSTIVGATDAMLLGMCAAAHIFAFAVPALGAPKKPWAWFLGSAAGLAMTYVVLCATVIATPCGDPYCAESQPIAGAILATLYILFVVSAAGVLWVVQAAANGLSSD